MNSACTVADYRSPVIDDLAAFMDGPFHTEPQSYILIKGGAYGGLPPYSYIWRKSNSPIGGTIIGNNQSLDYYIFDDSEEGFFINLTVNSSDGQTSTISRYIIVSEVPPIWEFNSNTN